ncbi:MAG: sugar phosphate isomerase/epimerase [Rubellimicrobium sp.]|nr:sugar phosphate isomerase/epimerase [Rubellimicrobium sp.]
MPVIACQLYSLRQFPPLADALAMLKAAGFRAVEGFGGLYDDPEALGALLDANGLVMPTGHFGLDLVEGDPARAIAIARTLGVGRVFVPYLMPADRPADRAGWAAFAARLARAGQPLREAGLAYGWHNHDFELADLGGGETPLDLIAATGIDIELDLAWVARAGQDPVTVLNRLGRQVTAVHVKDIAPPGTAADEDGWADVGHGIIDWAPVRAAIKALGIGHLVLEHDNPGDGRRFATRSLATVSAW